MSTSFPSSTLSPPYTVVMGLGVTGFACARFLSQQGVTVHVMDSRSSPPQLKPLRDAYPQVSYVVGGFDATILCEAQEIVMSPGLSLSEPALAAALQRGVPVISEIELFVRYATAPIIAITGSNGKSTVTTLLADMMQAAGLRVAVGGNLGTPALDLLAPEIEWYVLELSSFQLETTHSLNAYAATVLNVSEDHMDRYDQFADYCATKQRIFQGQGVMVLNADAPDVMAMQHSDRTTITFSGLSQKADFYSVQQHGIWQLRRRCQSHDRVLMNANEMPNASAIMRSNALAALALGEAVGISLVPMLDTLRRFKGLPHRCEWVAHLAGVDYFNDSKGTNVGATLAAIQGLERPQHLILIAGGEGKGADFSPLATIATQLKAVILIGRDADLLENVFASQTAIYHASSLTQAVQQAYSIAADGDAVLLSPACASFDMFDNYQQRGEHFVEAVFTLRANLASVSEH